MKRWLAQPGAWATTGGAIIFFGATAWSSYAHWANFEYRTFDLAYYVQALWQLLHGRFEVSVEGVPLLGNHVEPIVLLFLPFFALFRHPMVFVVLQNAALAAMAPIGYRVGRQLGIGDKPAGLLAIALLLTPPAAYVALHEFHPEALGAPLLLLMIYGRLRSSSRLFWTCAIALLACKENMSLVLAAYAAVHLVVEWRQRSFADLRRWYVWPLVVSLVWFALCTKVITPLLNPGAIDYLALYDRLGKTSGEILVNAVAQPGRIFAALRQSLGNGNLLVGLLLPFLGLPLLRPRWLVIAVPILLQHLLSWRSSEWQIYFHYAAPLIPLFWVAMTEAVSRFQRSPATGRAIGFGAAWAVALACTASQALFGPAGTITESVTQWRPNEFNRARKGAFIAEIPASSSVVAPLPYLSHLAMREKLYSLHYIFKGLKTLSRSSYEAPAPTEFVLIDYADSSTFDPVAGYYHPTMKTVDGRIIPSSDRLLHEFLRGASWTTTSMDELTLLRNSPSIVPPRAVESGTVAEIVPGTLLRAISATPNLPSQNGFAINTNWSFQGAREIFPWMLLRLTPRNGGKPIVLSRGLIAPDLPNGEYADTWRIMISGSVGPGEYQADAFFVDRPKVLWARAAGATTADLPPLAQVPVGPIAILSPGGPRN